MKDYCLYVYLDPRKPGKFTYKDISFLFEPFYVGKGRPSRPWDHVKESTVWQSKRNTLKQNKIRKIIGTGTLPFIDILDYGEEDYILEKETAFIWQIGRLITNTGPLVNIKTDNSHNENVEKNNRATGNYQEGKRYKTLINQQTGEMIQVETKFIELYQTIGFMRKSNWNRQRANNSKSRFGKENGMYGKSAIKGRKWITLATGEVKFLSPEQIKELNVDFVYGRKVDKNRRKRIVLEGAERSKYMSDTEIQNLPVGSKYQYGLQWKIIEKHIK